MAKIEIRDLLHEAAETHHVVYRIVDGDDPDWASWYADWLINLSELPELLGTKPVKSELVHLLVALDREYTKEKPVDPWEDYYARRITEHFGTARLRRGSVSNSDPPRIDLQSRSAEGGFGSPIA